MPQDDNYFSAKYGNATSDAPTAETPAPDPSKSGENYFSAKYGNADNSQPQNTQVAGANIPVSGQQSSGIMGSIGNALNSAGSTFMDGVEAFNRQFATFAEGAMALVPGLHDAAKQVHDNNEASYDLAKQRSPLATTIGAGAGLIGSGIAYGGPGVQATTLLGKMAAGAAFGGGYGYLNYADTQKDRLINSGIGATVGAAFPPAVSAVKGVANLLLPEVGNHGFLYRNAAAAAAALDDMIQRIKGQYSDGEIVDKIAQAKSAMSQTGVKLGPGEVFPETAGVDIATYKPNVSDKNNLVAPTYFKAAQGAKDNLYDIVDKMAPPSAKQDVSNLFKTMEGQFVSADGSITNDAASAAVPDVLKNNRILTQKYSQVLGAQSSLWKDLPDNSIAKLHKVKELIDDDLYKSTPNHMGTVEKSLGVDDKLALQEARSQVSSLLQQSPEYAQAMKLGQQAAIQQTYQNMLKNANIKAGTSNQIDPTSIRSAIFGNEKNQSQFIKDVITTGGDPDKAKAVIDVIDSLSKSPLKRILNSAYSGDTTYQRLYGKPTAIIQSAIGQAANARYYKAALDLAVSDTWAEDMTKVLSMPNKQIQKTTMEEILNKAMRIGVKAVIKNVPPMSAIKTFGAGQQAPSQLGGNPSQQGYLGQYGPTEGSQPQ